LRRWKISNLFLIPPLARDWAVGFTPTLDEYTEDLTASQYQLHRKHIIDRQKEREHFFDILLFLEKNNFFITTIPFPEFGARNMERLIRDAIEDTVAKIILENKVKESDIIRL